MENEVARFLAHSVLHEDIYAVKRVRRRWAYSWVEFYPVDYCRMYKLDIRWHCTRFGAVGWSDPRSYSTPGPVSTGMGDRIGGSTPGAGNLSQSNQPPRSTQPGHPSVGRGNEYRPMGGDALRLGVEAGMVLFAGDTVWSISERVRGVCVDALYKSTWLRCGAAARSRTNRQTDRWTRRVGRITYVRMSVSMTVRLSMCGRILICIAWHEML